MVTLRTLPADGKIIKPGLYDLAPSVYHGDPVPNGSLSPTRAKMLLDEAGPAKFRHRQTAGQEYRAEFDLGHAAHALALGKGETLVVVEADSWRTKAAQEARTAARAAGATPLLAAEMRQVEDMAEALSRNSLAVESLTGVSEVAMFHDAGPLWLRGQMDVMGEGCTTDYKTTVDASSVGAVKAVWRYRYYMQAAWYRKLRGELTGDWLPYRIVFQEKAAPYLVSVWEVPDDYLTLGLADMDDAIALYLVCRDADEWPGYPDSLQILSPPDWAINDEIEI